MWDPGFYCTVLWLGTIEEKIYQRQVMKSGLAGGLESAGLATGAVNFTHEELRQGLTFIAVVVVVQTVR